MYIEIKYIDCRFIYNNNYSDFKLLLSCYGLSVYLRSKLLRERR